MSNTIKNSNKHTRRESQINNSKTKSSSNNKNARNPGNNKIASIFHIVAKCLKVFLLIAVLIIVFYPPYLRGLYFEEEQTIAEIITLICFAVFWIYKLLKKDRVFLKTPIDYASFALMLVYLISVFVSVSLRLAIAEWIKYCMYFAVFFMISELANAFKSKMIVLWTIVFSSSGVSVLGIDGVAGGHITNNLNVLIAKVLRNPGHNIFFDTFTGGRINSTIQYPNALASYLMATFFISIAIMLVSSKLWEKATAAAFGFIILLTSVFTLSRGAFLLLPIIAVLFIFVLPAGSRIKGIVFALSIAIPTAVVSVKFSGYVSNPTGNGKNIWILVLIGAVTSSILVLLLSSVIKWLERINWKVYTGIVIILLFLGVIGTAIALNISIPLELSHSSNQKDSVISVRKSATLKPGAEYKLIFDVNSSMTVDKPNSYTVDISYRNEKDILQERDSKIASLVGKASNGLEKKEIIFKVPSESKIVNIDFTNTFQGTKAIFNNAEIADATTGKTVKKVILKYKYIPDYISSRFEGITATRSGAERSVFYKDGLEIFKDHWFLGAGGGAWALLYFAHQSYLYWTTQAHNYFMQVAIECGVIGFLIFIFLMLSILVMFLSEYRNKWHGLNEERILQGALFTSIVALAMHSAIDFDFSLSAVFLLFWELTALFNSRYKNSSLNETKELKLPFIERLLKKIDQYRAVRSFKIHPVFGLVAALAIVVFPIVFNVSKGYAAKAEDAISVHDNYTAIHYMAKAVEADPFNPVYRLNYAKYLTSGENPSTENMKEADKQAAKADSLAKYDFNFYIGTQRTDILPRITDYYFSTGNIDKGLSVVDRLISLRPFVPEKWQERVGAYYEVAMFYFGRNETEKALSYTDKTLALIKEAKKVNEKNMFPFMFTTSTSEMFERLKYVKDHITSQSKIDVNKIVFYNMPSMDINLDNIPDQWSTNMPSIVKLSYSDSSMDVDITDPAKQAFLFSRVLSLQPGKMYTVEVELVNNSGITSIPFGITGISKENEVLKPDGNVYRADVSVPTDFKANNNTLMLGITGKYKIKGIVVTEK